MQPGKNACVWVWRALESGLSPVFIFRQGEIDFAMVKGYLPERAIKIMEIQPSARGHEILDGLDFLKEKGFGP